MATQNKNISKTFQFYLQVLDETVNCAYNFLDKSQFLNLITSLSNVKIISFEQIFYLQL